MASVANWGNANENENLWASNDVYGQNIEGLLNEDVMAL